MARVRPFRGVRYDPYKVKMADVVAPPYDIISPELREELLKRSPFNVVRLILPEGYRRAALLWRSWLEEGVLLREDRPCLYVLRDTFSTFGGRRMTRFGLLAEVRLEPPGEGKVFPHERTFPKVREDRLNLLRATGAQFSPVFGLYEEPEGEVEGLMKEVQAEPPLVDYEDGGVRRTLWRIPEGPVAFRISERLEAPPILIADGHHRYETALAYRKEYGGEGDGHEYVLMYLVDVRSSGPVVLPVHRIVLRAPVEEDEAFARLGRSFELSPSEDLARLWEEVERDGAFGLYRRGRLYRMRPMQEAEDALKDLPPFWRRVPAAVLQALALEGALGITPDMVRSGEHLRFTPDLWEAMRAVDEGEALMAFIVPPTEIEHVRMVAEAGEVMPHKSTYFHPKPPSGLVMREVRRPPCPR
ncbi:MAG TPA: DUF1015 domain-containing protein [Candidatus Latescibacteria bacterium]|nr:DUF1015 domain-containing protein [Candidatus Latescibacterota bacterium]